MKRLDFFQNTGGLNITDSPFIVKDDQATDGYNFEYTRTGSVRSAPGFSAINSSADTQTRSIGLGILNPISGSKLPLRAAGTKLQSINVDTGVITNVSEDTSAVNSDYFSSNQPVAFTTANLNDKGITFFSGGGATYPYAYVGDSSLVTKVGVELPTNVGSLFALSAGSSGGTLATGTYYYAIVQRKRATLATSNATLDLSVAVTLGQKVTITLPACSDTTKYDKFLIYRSGVGGASAFTTGYLVATVDSTTSSYVDDGTVEAGLDVVPRVDSSYEDHQPPATPTGTYKYSVLFNGMLVIADANSVSFSQLNGFEYFPTDKYIIVPSGGEITGLGKISFSSPYQTSQEMLVIFKQQEMWVVTGTGVLDTTTGIYDLSLKFIDSVGCANQSLVVNAGGYICWVDYRGIYMWNGSGKPAYISRPIESLWSNDGDLDKANLIYGFGMFYRKKNMIIWFLSHKIYGLNKFELKLDIRLSSPRVSENISEVITDGVFMPGKRSTAMYAGTTYLPTSTNDEYMLLGDASGYVYRGYESLSENGSAISFNYTTKWLNFGQVAFDKRIHKVVVYVDEAADYDLTLTYYSKFSPYSKDSGQIVHTLSPIDASQVGRWDIGVWDYSLWDQGLTRIKRLVYNLNSTNNANEGEAFRFVFTSSGVNQPVVIHGFSVYYDEVAARV